MKRYRIDGRGLAAWQDRKRYPGMTMYELWVVGVCCDGARRTRDEIVRDHVLWPSEFQRLWLAAFVAAIDETLAACVAKGWLTTGIFFTPCHSPGWHRTDVKLMLM